MYLDLKNKKFLVIGAAGRIGKSITSSIYQSKGIPIAVDLDISLLKEKFNSFEHGKFHLLEGNVCSQKSIQKIISEALSFYNEIDGAIYCAYPKSKGWGNNIENLKEINLREDLYLQLGAPIIFAKEILKVFSKNNCGNLINISSIQGVCAPKFEHYEGTNMTSPIEYSAIKSGIISITKWLAKYYKNKNIRINCISPGGIADSQPNVFVQKYRESCTNKGLLEGEDISSIVNFLLSDYSYAINGQNIIVDDGWSL